MLPVPTEVPPQLPVIHLRVVPDPPVAVSVLLAPEQIVDGFAEADEPIAVTHRRGDVRHFVSPRFALLHSAALAIEGL